MSPDTIEASAAVPPRQIADSLVRYTPEHSQAAQDGPCPGCRHFERCTAEVIACEAFALYARFGDQSGPERWRYAPRQPSAAILEKMVTGPGR